MPAENAFITDIIKDFVLKMVQEIMKNYPEYKYSTDPLHSKIDIMDSYARASVNPNQKPAIVIERGPIEVVDTFLVPYVNKNIWSQTTSGEVMLRGAITLRVVTNDSLLSERICSFLFQAFISLKLWTITKGVVRIDPVNIGVESPINVTSDIQYMATPITLSLTFSYGWVTSPLTPAFINGITIISDASRSDLGFTMVVK